MPISVEGFSHIDGLFGCVAFTTEFALLVSATWTATCIELYSYHIKETCSNDCNCISIVGLQLDPRVDGSVLDVVTFLKQVHSRKMTVAI